jgi:hypothetical protein
MTTNAIAVDWSGAKRNAAKKIWLAAFRGGCTLEKPSNGRDRSGIFEYLVSAGLKHPHTVVGIDFAFSFPTWFMKDQGCATAEELWDHVELNQLGEQWLKECRNPFWGKPGCKNPDRAEEEQFRKTDCDFRVKGIRPKSIFQVGGAGAVGTSSIRGMCLLLRLAREGFSIWPFQPDGWPRVIEIWPRALTGEVHKTDPVARKKYMENRYSSLDPEWRRLAEGSEDAFDAIVSVIQMNRHINELESLKRAADPQYLMEGRIWQPGTA